MKHLAKKILTLCMAAAMAAGMATIAFAAETKSYFVLMEMTYAPYRITNVLMDNASIDMTDSLPPWYQKSDSAAVMSWEQDIIGSAKITTDSIITLEFGGHDGIVLTQLENNGKDLKLLTLEDTFSLNTRISNNSEYITVKNAVLEENEYGDQHYKEGITVQFKREGTFILSVKGIDAQTDSTYDMFAPIICEVSADDVPNTMQAMPTTSKVLVNGTAVEFEAYEINGNNYFKLRDIAAVLSGTAKQFDVRWDGAQNQIRLISQTPYTKVGGELSKGSTAPGVVTPGSATLLLDGTPIKLIVYTIGSNNYFKLRELGTAFDFSVGWDSATGTIQIDTTAQYTPET